MWVQEIEEANYSPMTMADESAYQHANFGTCSFDCPRCDPFDEDAYYAEQAAEFDAVDPVNLETILQEMWDYAESRRAQEFEPVWF